MNRRRPLNSAGLLRAATAMAVLLLSRYAAAANAPEPIRAQTAQGTVEGQPEGDVVAFFGIPYATPPLGAKRFLPPEPPASWSGVRPALDMSPACPQLIDDDPTENNEAVMAEDCLGLNVWTPKVDSKKRPVMVWIHGGAFVVGASRNTFYNGSHLSARGDVVVVSINYRLGAWGFLALAPYGAKYAESANVGLLDQIAALNWVKHNIEKFGGDPNNVTIFGESAGASSVGALLSMPAAQGLFAKAILQSGVPSQRPVEAYQKATRLAAEFLKLAGVQSPQELETKSMKDLLKVQESIFSTHTDLGTFVPSIDGASIKEQPFAVVAEGRGARVPLLIGNTAEEMRYFATAEDLGIEQKPRKLLLSQLEATVGNRAPEVLGVYERLYPKQGDAAIQIASDALLRLPAIRLAEKASAHQPVYMYLFTYRSNSTYKNFGSAHAMELPFVFGVVNAPEVIVFTGRDPKRFELADKVMDTWAAFARNGDPTLPSGPKWPTYDPVKRTTMELGPQIRTVDDPWSEQRLVWGSTPPAVGEAWRLLQVN